MFNEENSGGTTTLAYLLNDRGAQAQAIKAEMPLPERIEGSARVQCSPRGRRSMSVWRVLFGGHGFLVGLLGEDKLGKPMRTVYHRAETADMCWQMRKWERLVRAERESW